MTARPTMDAARFRALLASYGADLARWPEDERRAAEDFAASSADAGGWLAGERRLDMLLDDAPEMSVSPVLLRRIAEIPVRHPAAASGYAGALGRMRNWVFGMAAMAAMGAAVGIVIPDSSSRTSETQVSDDLSPLAWAGDLSDEFDLSEDLDP